MTILGRIQSLDKRPSQRCDVRLGGVEKVNARIENTSAARL